MIKTNELMIGDLVRLTDGQIAKVVAIDATGNVDVEFETKSFRHHVNAHEEDIEPIPFTEEILLKTGFRIIGSFIELVEYALNDVDAEICVFYNRESNNPYFYTEIANVKVEIKYFHELQHLLRLCGGRGIADNLKI
jgi:hypothetical protein